MVSEEIGHRVNESSESIVVRDKATGAVVWNIAEDDVGEFFGGHDMDVVRPFLTLGATDSVTR